MCNAGLWFTNLSIRYWVCIVVENILLFLNHCHHCCSSLASQFSCITVLGKSNNVVFTLLCLCKFCFPIVSSQCSCPQGHSNRSVPVFFPFKKYSWKLLFWRPSLLLLGLPSHSSSPGLISLCCHPWTFLSFWVWIQYCWNSYLPHSSFTLLLR